MFIKAKFLKDGKLRGRAYTYIATEDVSIGDKVILPGGATGEVVGIEIPPESVSMYADMVKEIVGKKGGEENDVRKDGAMREDTKTDQGTKNPDRVFA